ncbi:hypothetical protein GGI1_08421, partial [Acidithiobacillus sp. GGI-221]
MVEITPDFSLGALFFISLADWAMTGWTSASPYWLTHT